MEWSCLFIILRFYRLFINPNVLIWVTIFIDNNKNAYPLALGLFFSGFSCFTVRSALQLLVLLTCFHIAVLLTSSVMLMEVIGIFMIFPLASGMVRFPGNGGGFPQFNSCGIIQIICRNFTFLYVK